MKENKIIVLVDSKLYSLEAIYGAAYVFLDKAYIFLEKAPKRKIQITLKAKKKPSKNLRDDFLNELLNFGLRDKISKNNKKIREYIISKALSSAFAGDATLERKQLDQKSEYFWKKDSSGIVIPWREKIREEKTKKS